MVMPAGTLSSASSLPPTGDVRTTGVHSVAGGDDSTAGADAGVLAVVLRGGFFAGGATTIGGRVVLGTPCCGWVAGCCASRALGACDCAGAILARTTNASAAEPRLKI